MSELPYFPLYMGDYLADTGSLDTTEHGAYLLIMIEYYKRRRGPAADPKKLAKITKMSPKRWQKISETILEFFEIREGRLWQKRAEQEIKNMLQTHEVLSENGRKGAAKRWGKKNSPAIAPPLAPPSEGQWQSESESELKPKTLLSSCEQPDDLQPEILPIEDNPDLDAAEQEGEPDPQDRANWKALFEFWQEQHDHPKAKFTKEREAKLRARLREGYSLDECAAAIRGVKNSKFHMGDNPDGKVWDDWSLIFRSGAYLEKFRDLDQEGAKV